MRRLLGLLLLALAGLAPAAHAQIGATVVTTCGAPQPYVQGDARAVTMDTYGNLCTAGGGGAGGGATAANQTTQITAADATNAVLGTAVASPTANTIADRLKTLNTTLGSPLQAGGTVAVGGSVAVTGAFFQATQPVSLAALPALSAGAAVIGHVIVDTAPTTAVTGTFWQATQPVSGTVTANAGTNLNTSALALDTTLATTNTDLGPPGAAACATDNGSCALNALLQRNNQRLTTINTTLGSPIQATGGTVGLVAGSAVIGHVIVDTAPTTAVTGTFWQATQPVSLSGNQAVNVAQVNGVATLTGTGAQGTGAQRVTVATDTATVAGSASLPAGTNVIGKASIDQTTPGQGGTNSVYINSAAFDVATTITRPANTTAYTANDVLGGALDLGVLGSSAKAVQITSVQLEADITAVPTGQTSWVLYLYNVTPPSAIADNGAWDLPSGDRASFLGSIAIPAMADLGSTLYVESNGLAKQVLLSGTHLFGYLVTVGGFTPAANSEVYKITVHTKAV